MRRVSLVGVPGAGKTTVGRELAWALGVPFVELDAMFHLPGWAELPSDEFRARVLEIVQGDGWVVDGNYGAVQDLVWGAADTVVWLDLPRPLVMRRLVRRTLHRVMTREQLWNGNHEQLSNLYHRDPERSILRWAWVKHPEYVERYGSAMKEARENLDFVRLRSPAEVDDFLLTQGRPRR